MTEKDFEEEVMQALYKQVDQCAKGCWSSTTITNVGRAIVDAVVEEMNYKDTAFSSDVGQWIVRSLGSLRDVCEAHKNEMTN